MGSFVEQLTEAGVRVVETRRWHRFANQDGAVAFEAIEVRRSDRPFQDALSAGAGTESDSRPTVLVRTNADVWLVDPRTSRFVIEVGGGTRGRLTGDRKDVVATLKAIAGATFEVGEVDDAGEDGDPDEPGPDTVVDDNKPAPDQVPDEQE